MSLVSATSDTDLPMLLLVIAVCHVDHALVTMCFTNATFPAEAC